MGYSEPDFWATCAQLLRVLWLIITVELRLPQAPDSASIELRYARIEFTRMRYIVAGFAVAGTAFAGIYSLMALVTSVMVLRGGIEPAENWANITSAAVAITGTVALLMLVSTALSRYVRAVIGRPPLDGEAADR
jgi:hypothetical protein